MKLRTLLAIVAIGFAPSALSAQPAPQAPDAPDLPHAALPPAPPSAQTPPSPPAPSRPVVAVVPEAPKAPPAPPAAPLLQTPPVAPKPVAPPAPAVAPVTPGPPRKRGQMINVRIDVTLSDSKGEPKVLTMTVADQESGMNRTTAVVVPGATAVDYSFNADASPEVVGDRIRLRLTADAVVPVEAERATAIVPKLALRQSQTIVLRDGETMEIARAADPASARTFVLSVKATIQR